MKILAVEFSSEKRSVAIVSGTALEPRVCGFAEEIGGRNTHAFALIEEALRQAKMEREEIECIGVGLGPGSYTGIRAAIALAQGWQLARDVKLVGIGSVECLAAQLRDQGTRGMVHLMVDAQRNEFYLATWELTDSGIFETSPLKIVPFAEIEKKLREGETVIGPEAIRWFGGAKNLFAEAGALGRIALSRTDFVPGEKLEPIYLRETNFLKAPPLRVFGAKEQS